MSRFIVSTFNLVLLLLFWMAATPAMAQNGLQIGDQAPDFSLKNVDGEMVSLTDFQDAKGVVVVFTCNTCPYSVMYEQRLIELHKKYADKGYPIVAINPNDPVVKAGDSFEEMQKRAKSKQYPFAYLVDEKQEIYPAYGATRTPHIFLLDKDRTVQYIGALDNNAQDAASVSTRYVEDAIAALEMGKTPATATTKAIGCGIKTRRKS